MGPARGWIALRFLLLVFLVNRSHGLVYNSSSPSCDFAHMPPSDPIPPCAANASATLDEAIARAWEFAPVVHFHTLERTPLQVRHVFTLI
jgi:hypothetical protein